MFFYWLLLCTEKNKLTGEIKTHYLDNILVALYVKWSLCLQLQKQLQQFHLQCESTSYNTDKEETAVANSLFFIVNVILMCKNIKISAENPIGSSCFVFQAARTKVDGHRSTSIRRSNERAPSVLLRQPSLYRNNPTHKQKTPSKQSCFWGKQKDKEKYCHVKCL